MATSVHYPTSQHSEEVAELYIDLLKKCITRYIHGDAHQQEIHVPARTPLGVACWVMRKMSRQPTLAIVRHAPFNAEDRAAGKDWPTEAETMIGLRRLDNLQRCVTDVIRRGVPGDLIETGVWRGGACILMRAVLRAYGDTQRTVWLADSFQGLPKPDASRYPSDAGDSHWTFTELAVSLEDVKENFRRYGLLDGQVRFLPGWFRDTLPKAPIERLAVLRLDGDMYESTIDALRSLYPKLSAGGYLIVDDYGSVAGCRQAIEDYRRERGITTELHDIDGLGAFWQREA